MKDLIPAAVISAVALVLMAMCTPSYAEPDEYVSLAASRDQRDIAAIMDQAYTIGRLQVKIVELEERNKVLMDAMDRIADEVSEALDPQ